MNKIFIETMQKGKSKKNKKKHFIILIVTYVHHQALYATKYVEYYQSFQCFLNDS